MDALQRISVSEVPRLLEVLRRDLPHSTVVHHWLVVQTEWSEKIPGMSVHVLCPGGRWQHGTVVAFTDGLALANKKYGVVYARPRHDAELAAALTSTRAVPWRDVLHFSGVLERHVPIVRAAAAAAGVSLPPEQSLCHLLHFPEHLLKLIDDVSLSDYLPDPSVRVCRLEGRHLDEVWRLRPLFPDSYKPVIRACLEHNLSAGVFVTRPDGSEVLASMALQTPYGGMGMGATRPEYLRRGFQSLAVAHITKALRRKGTCGVHGHVALNNGPMLNFCQKNDIEFVTKTARVDISPGDGTTVRGKL